MPDQTMAWGTSGDGGSAIDAALRWLGALLAGDLATVLAVLAVAGVGFALLQGRLATRRALRVVLGAFILFGAPGIAAALAGLARPDASESLAPPEPAPSLAPVPPPPPPNPDPYAGASVPM